MNKYSCVLRDTLSCPVMWEDCVTIRTAGANLNEVDCATLCPPAKRGFARHMTAFLLSLLPTICAAQWLHCLIPYSCKCEILALTSARIFAYLKQTSGMPLVVPDVVDLIVDELRDDTSALEACALVATVFKSRTRQHLFDQAVSSASSYLRCAHGDIRFMARPGGNTGVTPSSAP
jgi:hypothetical protein